MAVIYVVEPGKTGGPGAMGARILVGALERAGHRATHLRLRSDIGVQGSLFAADGGGLAPHMIPPDAWFISTIYPRQWLWVPHLLRLCRVPIYSHQRGHGDPLVVFGGQTSFAPEPIAPFADVIALGDGEVTGVWLADRLGAGLSRADVMAESVGRRGYYVPSAQTPPDPFVRVESEHIDPTLLRVGENRRSVAVEMARGCRSRCAFCPIGWAGGAYREADPCAVRAVIAQHPGAKLNMYAPDFSALSWAHDAEEFAESHGCKQSGRDARMDTTLRALDKGHASVRSYSFGVEGLSERMRVAIAKPIPTARIVDVMRHLASVSLVKWYLIFGLPGETQDDRDEFHALLTDARRVFPGNLELTLTHFQSVPHTPLQWAANEFDADGYQWVMDLRSRLAAEHRARGGAGGWTQASQPKGRELHESDAWLQRADRSAARWIEGLDARESMIASGAWREHLDVRAVLRERATGDALPWSHVDVGGSRVRLARAWDRYRAVVAGAPRAAA